MKICPKCGAVFEDGRFSCVDCGVTLKRASKQEEERVNARIKGSLNNLSDRFDTFYVSKLDKTAAMLSVIGIIAGIVLCILLPGRGERFAFLVIAVMFFAVAGVDAAFPKAVWALERLRLSFTIAGAEEAEPSDFFLLTRKLGYWLALLGGIAALIAGIVL